MLDAIDVELAYIGACLTVEDAIAESTVTGDDFDNPTLGRLFDRMLVRYQNREGVSQALLSDEFPELMREIWTSTEYLSEVAKWSHHEQTIRDRSTRRRLKLAALRISSIADGNDMDGIVDRARAEVDAALRGDAKPVTSMLTDAQQVLTEHRSHVALVPSPWRALNEAIGGFGPGRMYVIGARPGVGKSAVASQIAHELAGHGPVVFATMEMDKGEVYSRIVSQQAEVYYGSHVSDFALQKERAWLASGVRDIRVLDAGTQSVASIRAAVRSTSRDGQVAGVIVDYIHLLTGEGENETTRIAGITRGLKQLAMDFKVPVIALSQLNRAVSSRHDGKPNLADLRGSGAIEQDGDVVIFLYRDEDGEGRTMNNTVNVFVGKNRQGPSFVDLALVWQGEFVRAVDA